MDAKIKYKCPKCGWVGTEYQMKANARWDPEHPEMGEEWSTWICPQCKTWWQLEDYERDEAEPVGEE